MPLTDNSYPDDRFPPALYCRFVYKEGQEVAILHRPHPHKPEVLILRDQPPLSLSHTNLIYDEGLRSSLCAFGSRRLWLVPIVRLRYRLIHICFIVAAAPSSSLGGGDCGATDYQLDGTTDYKQGATTYLQPGGTNTACPTPPGNYIPGGTHPGPDVPYPRPTDNKLKGKEDIQPVGTNGAGPIPSHYLGGGNPPGDYVPAGTNPGPDTPSPTDNYVQGKDVIQPAGTNDVSPGTSSTYIGGGTPPGDYVPVGTNTGTNTPSPTDNDSQGRVYNAQNNKSGAIKSSFGAAGILAVVLAAIAL